MEIEFKGATKVGGAYATVVAGDYGTAIAGDYGKANAGRWGSAQAGVGGWIMIEWFDGFRARTKVGHIGVDGLEADVLYRVSPKGEFIRA